KHSFFYYEMDCWFCPFCRKALARLKDVPYCEGKSECHSNYHFLDYTFCPDCGERVDWKSFRVPDKNGKNAYYLAIPRTIRARIGENALPHISPHSLDLLEAVPLTEIEGMHFHKEALKDTQYVFWSGVSFIGYDHP
ncbi:MAG: hypothetical protein HY982_02105, partial [Candidatus Magasanikbacteria bacterium]|nr:hypothetical protein [Candidatus Magasanikbacteria bacterium]